MNDALLLVLSAVLTAWGLWFQDWREDRSLESRRQRVLKQANDQVAFLKEWLAVQESTSPDDAKLARAEVSAELKEVYQRVNNLKYVEDRDDGRTFNLRRVLLFHLRPASPLTRILQGLFYISLVWMAILTLSVVNEFSVEEEHTYWTFIGYVANAIALGLVPALVVRGLALRSAQPAPQGTPRHGGAWSGETSPDRPSAGPGQ